QRHFLAELIVVAGIPRVVDRQRRSRGVATERVAEAPVGGDGLQSDAGRDGPADDVGDTVLVHVVYVREDMSRERIGVSVVVRIVALGQEALIPGDTEHGYGGELIPERNQRRIGIDHGVLIRRTFLVL